MTEVTSRKPPRTLLIVAIAATLWNALGVVVYLMDVTISDEALAAMPAAEAALYSNIPAWATSAHAFAVFGGLAGSVGLLLRKKWAALLFTISLIGVVVQMSHVWFLTDAIAVMGAVSIALPAFIIIVAALLLWYSRRAAAKGWLA